MKIAIIGGGSTYSPELIEGLILRGEALDLREVVLMDIDAGRLRVVGGFAERMARHARAPFAVRATLERAEALDGADFVLTQIRVGQNPARQKDTLLGLRHGLIGQETTGVGGCAKALRTIPVLAGLAAEMKERSPEAFLVNFTNPSGLVTEALHRVGMTRLVGLCNVPAGMLMDLAGHLKVEPARLRLDYVGLNHLGWVRKVLLDGRDVLPMILETLTGLGRPANIPDMDYEPALIRALGFLPNPYLRYFYMTGKLLEEQRQAPRTRAEEVAEIEAELLRKYADPAQVTKPAELEKRGGAWYSKIAVDLIDAVWNDRRVEHIVNLPSGGAVEGLDPAQTAEIPAVVGRSGATPLHVGAVEPKIAGLMRQVKAYETLTVEAGLEGSYDKALLALMTHPLCGAEKAKAVLDDMIATHGLGYLK